MEKAILAVLILILFILVALFFFIDECIKDVTKKKNNGLNVSFAPCPQKTINQLRTEMGFPQIIDGGMLLPTEYSANLQVTYLKLANTEIDKLRKELQDRNETIRNLSKDLSAAEATSARWERLCNSMEHSEQRIEEKLNGLPCQKNIYRGATFRKEN